MQKRKQPTEIQNISDEEDLDDDYEEFDGELESKFFLNLCKKAVKIDNEKLCLEFVNNLENIHLERLAEFTAERGSLKCMQILLDKGVNCTQQQFITRLIKDTSKDRLPMLQLIFGSNFPQYILSIFNNESRVDLVDTERLDILLYRYNFFKNHFNVTDISHAKTLVILGALKERNYQMIYTLLESKQITPSEIMVNAVIGIQDHMDLISDLVKNGTSINQDNNVLQVFLEWYNHEIQDKQIDHELMGKSTR